MGSKGRSPADRRAGELRLDRKPSVRGAGSDDTGARDWSRKAKIRRAASSQEGPLNRPDLFRENAAGKRRLSERLKALSGAGSTSKLGVGFDSIDL
jgi:hypothetical protein